MSEETDPSLPMEISVSESAKLINNNPETTLLDVREALEVQVCQLKGSLHVSTGQIPLQLNALPRDKHLLVYCHHGHRSLMVAQFLRSHGFPQVQSIKGGIDAWSREIDPTIARY